MTLELTPKQTKDLNFAVKAALDDRIKSKALLWDSSARIPIEQDIQDLQSLHDLLEKSTAVILYQP